jgi:putative ABC transport system permease protein
MAVPLVYNLRSVRVRWVSAFVAVLGIAGTVGVFVAVLALARGFEATLVASASPRNGVVRRAGATSEYDSSVTLEQVRVLEELPEVARDTAGPFASAEVVVIAAFPLRDGGTDANLQARGVSPHALRVHEGVRIVAGRTFRPGLMEMTVGRNAVRNYAGLELGAKVPLGGTDWEVVGLFDAGGSSFDSEIWCDADVLNQTYQRPPGVFQSVTVRLVSPDSLDAFKAAVARDPRLLLQIERESEYYARQSRQVSTLILALGTLVTSVMGIGAIFGALNTMYAAVAERGREIATLRALGFSRRSVVAAFLVESLAIAGVGGLVGAVAVLPLNGLVTGTMNWQTFSHIAFAFRITPSLMVLGVVFALAMGVLGGLPPAVRAARRPVAQALREL